MCGRLKHEWWKGTRAELTGGRVLVARVGAERRGPSLVPGGR